MIGLRYEQGPLLAIATWDQIAWAPSEPAARGRALQLGVAYDFEVVKIAVARTRQQDGYVGLDGGSG